MMKKILMLYEKMINMNSNKGKHKQLNNIK